MSAADDDCIIIDRPTARYVAEPEVIQLSDNEDDYEEEIHGNYGARPMLPYIAPKRLFENGMPLMTATGETVIIPKRESEILKKLLIRELLVAHEEFISPFMGVEECNSLVKYFAAKMKAIQEIQLLEDEQFRQVGIDPTSPINPVTDCFTQIIIYLTLALSFNSSTQHVSRDD